jgi:hypothetical protein
VHDRRHPATNNKHIALCLPAIADFLSAAGAAAALSFFDDEPEAVDEDFF